MPEGKITIKKGREKPILQQHPWIFSGAIASAENANPGDIVTVLAHDGQFLARGYWNAKSQIQVRILTWQDENIDDAWWRSAIRRSIIGGTRMNRRSDSKPYIAPIFGRLINAENDFIPGLIVDWYDDWVVLQALTLGIDHRKTQIVSCLMDVLSELNIDIKGVYERSDVDVRGKEGLQPTTGVLFGDSPPALVDIPLLGHFFVDIQNGHKTGAYLDQVNNWFELRNLINYAFGREHSGSVLNLFSFTGGFGFASTLESQMRVINVDSSAEALRIAQRSVNFTHPDYRRGDFEYVEANVFDYLREAVERGDQHDVVVVDPPKFAHNKQQVNKASRGYKDVNLNAFKVVKPGGYLMTFSCSGAISADLFQKIVFGALADSGRQAQIVKQLGPGEDHPVALTFPEGAYLKGLLLRVF